MTSIFKIYSGKCHPDLSKKISRMAKIPQGKIEINRFPDGEIDVWIKDKIEGKKIVLCQPLCPPVNENLIELALIADAARRAGAESIIAIISYLGYARKEKMNRPGEPISARLIARILQSAGINQIITFDLHTPAIQGFFDIPVVDLKAATILAQPLKSLTKKVIVSPDIGGVKRARYLADILKSSLAIIEKKRFLTQNKNRNPESLSVIGNVKDKNCIIIDDMIASGGTLLSASQKLKEAGAKKIYAVATHLVLPAVAKEKLKKANIEQIITTDTIPITAKDRVNKFKIVSIAGEIKKAL